MAKRAQASTEYLIILAVVVIVALAVVGVLGGFPTVSKGISEKDSATYWQSSDIAIVRYFANGTGTYAIIRNNKNFAIKIQNQTSIRSDLIMGTAAPTLSPGESTTNFIMISNGTQNLGTACTSPGSFVVQVSNLTFNYTDLTYGTTYLFTGIKPLMGSC